MMVQHGGHDRQSTNPAVNGVAGQQVLRTAAEIILACFRERYAPVFRIGTAIRTASGATVPMNEACAVCDSRLIALLESATNAPKYAGGSVKQGSLPSFFKTWSKVAFSDLLNELPDEDGVTDGGGVTLAREEFRRLVREALLSEVTLADRDDKEVERRSLIDWCHKFAKEGPWRSIRSKKLWCKTVVHGDGEIRLRVALRHELFAQIRADQRLREIGANTFARRAARYGVGQSSREVRPHGQSAIVLDDDFVADLTAGLPEPDVQTDPA